MILLLIFRVLCRAVNLRWLPGLCNTPKVSFIFCTLLKASRLRWCSPVKHLALSRRRSRVQWNTRFALGPNKSRPEHFCNNIVSSSTSERTASFRNKEARDGAPACCNTLLCAATTNSSNGQMLNRTTLITTPMTIPSPQLLPPGSIETNLRNDFWNKFEGYLLTHQTAKTVQSRLAYAQKYGILRYLAMVTLQNF